MCQTDESNQVRFYLVDSVDIIAFLFLNILNVLKEYRNSWGLALIKQNGLN